MRCHGWPIRRRLRKNTVPIFRRDNGWSALGELGYEGVSLISIDDDWSAFRFRKSDYIKTMNRRHEMAMSKEGKERTKKK